MTIFEAFVKVKGEDTGFLKISGHYQNNIWNLCEKGRQLRGDIYIQT